MVTVNTVWLRMNSDDATINIGYAGDPPAAVEISIRTPNNYIKITEPEKLKHLDGIYALFQQMTILADKARDDKNAT